MKRKNDALVVVSEQNQKNNGQQLVKHNKRSKGGDGQLVEIPRTSDLLAPIVLLKGHQGAVNCIDFSSNGKYLASGSFDKSVLLWNVFGNCENYGMLKGHDNSVLDLCWSSDSERLVSCSADKTVCWWDTHTGDCIGLMEDHTSFVNTCSTSTVCSSVGIVASGGDDKAVRLWDPRERNTSTLTLKHPFEVTSLCFISESVGTPILFSGGIDGVINVWDIRKNKRLFTIQDFEKSDGIITGMNCNALGNHIYTNSSDGSICKWDARLLVADEKKSRYIQSYGYLDNNNKNVKLRNTSQLLLRTAISPNGERLATGSVDKMVPIWNTETGGLEYRLPGHIGPVLDVAFHPSQEIVASCSFDKNIYLGELATN